MKNHLCLWMGLAGWIAGGSLSATLQAQTSGSFSPTRPQTNREMRLEFSGTNGLAYRVDVATNLPSWQGFLTLVSTGLNTHLDTAAPYHGQRFYRAEQLTNTAVFTGDHLPTEAGDVIIHPINHASLVLQWNGVTIYCDPVGDSSRYAGLPRASLVLYTHGHGDHWSSSTLEAVRTTSTVIVAPQVVYTAMNTTQKGLTQVFTNGATGTVLGVGITAIPAYNFTASNHPLGVGNGYVLEIGGCRIYLSGDTEDIPAMRALRDIDVAFLAMNKPYTMNVSQAVSAVREFRPKIVYPFHYSPSNPTTDLNAFKQQVGTDLGIEVRFRKWY